MQVCNQSCISCVTYKLSKLDAEFYLPFSTSIHWLAAMLNSRFDLLGFSSLKFFGHVKHIMRSIRLSGLLFEYFNGNWSVRADQWESFGFFPQEIESP